MEKTKEETIAEEAKKAFMHYFIHRGNQEDINWEHEKSHWFVTVVSKYLENAYNEGRKEGFEAFREKAEEGVKKLPVEHSFKQPSFIRSTAQTVVSIEKRLILTTIKAIKQ